MAATSSVLPAALFLAMLAGPETGSAAAVPAPGSSLRADDYRVGTVTYRLASRGASFCRQSHPLTGMMLHHLGEYPISRRAEASRRFGLARGPGVLAVVEGSPAAQAGLLAGDVLLSVDNRPFPSPDATAAEPDDKKRRRFMEAAEAQLEEQLRSGPARLHVYRDGRVILVDLNPVRGCPARGRLARSGQPNAFADGRWAIMTTKLLGFIRNDDELAVAMAHELAHNILGHPGELENVVPKGILRNIGKNAARVHKTEEEADRLGIKLVWAAGYDVSAAIPFWRRLYAKYDPIPTPKLFRTHPSLAARERLINQTIAELRGAGSQLGAKRPEFGEGSLRQR
ncbi:MAG: M48 family metallopeptidase [Pseudomonadota bacterium]|nr:M48 family metallopeptidase [Pseudomonadota bacterium]